jgi:hypothetical protein
MFRTTHITRGLGGVAVAALLGSAVAAVAPAVTAAAAVPGLATVQAASPNNSVGKSVTVSCPAGTLVVDAGGFVTGVVGQVVLDDITPDAGLGSVTVTGYETDGTGANWRVHAFAKCADPLPGQVRVPMNSANNSRNKSVTANCPTGTNVIGVGSQTSGPSLGNVITDRIAPNAGLTSVTVSAKEDGTFTKNWVLTAYAICADPPPGLIEIAGSTVSSANKVETVTCPAGTVAIGSGARVTGARDDAMFAALLPAGATSGATGVEEDPTARNWALTTLGICASR